MRVEEIRWDNLTRLLELLFVNRECSRRMLASKMKVRNSTLSYLTGELQRLGMIRVKSVSLSATGRPSQFISLNRARGNVFGVKIGREAMKLSVFNFALEEVENHVYSLDGLDSAVERVLNELNLLTKLFNPVAIGVTTSGTVDIENNTVVNSPILAMKNYELSKIDSEKAAFVLCNDVDALHISQILREGFKDESSLAVTFGVGLGASFYYNNEIMIGEDGRSIFEFGHVGQNINGEKCYCGRTGCLETMASEYALIKEKAVTIRNFVENFEEFRNDIEHLRRNAVEEKNKKLYIPVLNTLAYNIASLVMLLRPKNIWLGGEGIVSDWIFEELKDRTIEHMGTGHEFNPLIKRVTNYNDWEKGAAFLGLRNYIKQKIKK